MKLINYLPDREKRVLQEKYGLLDGKPKNLEQLGRMFAVTRERIRQIEKEALKQLGELYLRRVKNQ